MILQGWIETSEAILFRGNKNQSDSKADGGWNIYCFCFYKTKGFCFRTNNCQVLDRFAVTSICPKRLTTKNSLLNEETKSEVQKKEGVDDHTKINCPSKHKKKRYITFWDHFPLTISGTLFHDFFSWGCFSDCRSAWLINNEASPAAEAVDAELDSGFDLREIVRRSCATCDVPSDVPTQRIKTLPSPHPLE